MELVIPYMAPFFIWAGYYIGRKNKVFAKKGLIILSILAIPIVYLDTIIDFPTHPPTILISIFVNLVELSCGWFGFYLSQRFKKKRFKRK